jgi:hypothetical protein
MGATTTYPAAVDAMFAMVLADWSANAPGIVGTTGVPEVRWQGVENPNSPAVGTYWLRVTEQIVIESQTSLAGGDGRKRYTSQGVIFSQVFVPVSDPAAYTRGRVLSEMCRNTFRKREPNDLVWFRNAKITPVGLTTGWYQFNISATFQFDEIV